MPGIILVAVVAGGLWLLLRDKSPEGASCPSYDAVAAFAKNVGYKVFYVENQSVTTWKEPLPEFLSMPKAKAYSQVDCSFFKWNGKSWEKDVDTNAELAAFKAPAGVSGSQLGGVPFEKPPSLAHPFVGL